MRRDMAWAVVTLAAAVLVVVGPGPVWLTALVVGVLGLLMLSRTLEGQRIDRRMQRANVILTVAPDREAGGWVVTSPCGVATQGETAEEAVRRARDSFVAVQRTRTRT